MAPGLTPDQQLPQPDYLMPWERQPEESEQAWEAFVVYRDMPHTHPIQPGERRRYQRSHLAVAGIVGKHRSLMDGWARTHRWADRCRAWDAEVDRERRAKLRSEALAAATQHASLAGAAVGAVGMPLRALAKPQLLLDGDGNVLVNEDGQPLTRDRSLELEAMATAPLLLLMRNVAALLPAVIAIRMEAVGNPHEPLPEPPEWSAEQDTSAEVYTPDRMLKLLEAAGEAGLLTAAGITPEAHEAAAAEAAALTP